MIDFGKFKKIWNLLAAGAAWLLLIIGTFLLPPPVGAGEFGGDGRLVAFGKYVVPLFLGLLGVPLLRWKTKRYTWAWWRYGLAALLLSITAYFLYEWLSTRWTCKYAGTRVVTGSTFMPGKEEWTRNNPQNHRTCEDWIMAHAGKINQIWTQASIDTRCAILALLYILSLPLFAGAVICIIQALYCNAPRPPRAPPE